MNKPVALTFKWDSVPEDLKSIPTDLIPVSPSTIWRWVRKGQFPRPFQLSPGVTAWNCDEITHFIEQKRLPLRGAK